MKNLYLSLLVLCIFNLTGNAQNYNCLQPGVRPYFINGNGYLRSMRIDSVRASGSDTIFYPYHTPRGNYLPSAGPLDSNGGSWLGKRVIKQANGTFLFDNMWKDTVVIKTQAARGESWIFFEDTTQINYKATVTAVDTITLDGVLDSVKTIVIEADSGGLINPIDPVNNFKIVLSKNNGFVQVFDLFTFPYHQPDSININRQFFDYYLDLVLGNLVGIADAGPYSPLLYSPDSINSVFHRVDFYDPTLMAIYNYSVGEILEFDDRKNFSPTAYGDYLTADTILSKTISPTSVVYTTAGVLRQKITMCCPVSTNTTLSSDYIPSYDTSLLINKTILPEEWKSTSFYHYHPETLPDTNAVCPVPTYVVDGNNIDYSSGLVIFESTGMGAQIGNYTTTYSIGYGVSRISAVNYSLGTGENDGYSYIQNGDSVCGAYVNPLAVNQITLPINHLDILPNPAHDVLTVSASGVVTDVVISDMMGQVVYRNSQCSSDKVQINIASLAPGMYLLKANNSVVRKFVKE